MGTADALRRMQERELELRLELARLEQELGRLHSEHAYVLALLAYPSGRSESIPATQGRAVS